MSIGRIWQTYWFPPAPLFDLAVCRVLCVGTQLLLLHRSSYLIEHNALPDFFYAPLPILRLILWPFNLSFPPPIFRPSPEAIWVIYWVTLAAGGFAFLGALTKISLPLFAFGNLFLQAFKWSFRDFHHGDALMVIFLCVLALSPAGGTLSLDALSRRLRKATRQHGSDASGILEAKSRLARFPLLLTQHLFAIIYLNAAVFKLWIAGSDWVNGYTLQFYVSRDALTRGSEFGVWLGQQHTLCVLLSWLSLIWEGSFFLVLILSALIWLYLPLGLLLHLGMCLTEVACFRAYFALYAVFVPWTHLAKRFLRGHPR